MSNFKYPSAVEVIDRLPSSAKLKLLTFREEAEAKRAVEKIAMDKASEAHRVKGGLEVALHRARTSDGGRHVARELMAKAQADIDRQTAEVARLNKARDDLSEKHRLQVGPLPRIEAWLEDHALATFAAIAPPEVKKPSKEDWPSFIESLRKRLAQLKADMERVAAAPIPSKVAKLLASKAVEELAASGRPDVGSLLRRGKLVWAGQARWGGDDAFGLHALVAWVDPDQLVSRLHAEIDAEADDTNALTDEQAAKETARLRTAILQVEREEEAAIVAAALDMSFVPRRFDADPRAILGLADNLPGFEEI